MPSVKGNVLCSIYSGTLIVAISASVPVTILIIFLIIIILSITLFCYHSSRRHQNSTWPVSGIENTYVGAGPSPPCSPAPGVHHVVAVFSDETPEEEKQTILAYLYTGIGSLNNHGNINVVHYQLACRMSKAAWLESEYGRPNTVILAVCNKQFYEEWNKSNGDSVVHTVHQLVLSHLNEGKTLDHQFAVVLFRPQDRQYIPTFLNNAPRIDISNVAGMAQFIQRVPEFQINV